ncbi:MAG: helix-turn-helix transcriptional regulator [Candidatus Melainabacteria bacterium]|nr:helix-turn-helix transcriptional regulator [Candidatus Melainabacteria bacterium]MBI3308984.1 helix-turn-helix transcriptional regulator [Candidatus Melainabacteria bacterium]
MDLPKYIHGDTTDLPKTLASRISYIRNARGIHMLELSKQARVSIKLLEEIEAGLEIWLSVAVRQRIARVLKVDPSILEEVEVKIDLKDLPKEPPLEIIERLQSEIMEGIKDLKCPQCGNLLTTWIQEGFDLSEQKIKSPKAHCTKCVFQLKS